MSVEIIRLRRASLASTSPMSSFGDPALPPVLLVMGLGTQMLGWPDEFCSALVAHGLRVIRFDNRDVGLSTHLHDARPPDLLAALSGDSSSASYTLSDMAADTVGLLDGPRARQRAHRRCFDGRDDRADNRDRAFRPRAVADLDHVHHGRRYGRPG